MSYTHKTVNGEDIPLTPEEIAEFEAQDAAIEAGAAGAALESAILGIVASYDLKRKGLKDRMAIALLKDGENEAVTRAALAAEWQQANADEEMEILLLLGG